MAVRRRHAVSIRAHFVNRARVLKDDDQFIAEIADTRGLWNARFPEFQIQGYALSEDELPPGDYEKFLLPPALAATNDDPPQSPCSVEEHPNGSRMPTRVRIVTERIAVIQAKQLWRQIILARCDHWFPANDYPNWLLGGIHPAHHFIAGCIIGKPALVPAEWIAQAGLSVCATTIDPSDPDAISRHPQVVFDGVYLDTLLTIMDIAFREQGSVSAEDFLDMRIQTERAASDKYREALANQRTYKVMPLFPGIIPQDVIENARAIADAVDDVPPVRARVRDLHAAGVAKAEIARRLGVSRRAVQHYTNAS